MKKTVAVIKFLPGSSWQEEVAVNSLKTIITAWQTFYLSQNKKNDITVDIFTEEVKVMKGGETK